MDLWEGLHLDLHNSSPAGAPTHPPAPVAPLVERTPRKANFLAKIALASGVAGLAGCVTYCLPTSFSCGKK